MDFIDKHQLWVPENTEILTGDGWLPIWYAFKTVPVILTADLTKRKFHTQQSTGWSKRSYTGKINRLVDGLLRMEFQTAFPIEKQELLNVPEFYKVPVFKQVDFEGHLFSVDIPYNLVFMRNHVKADLFTTKTLEDSPSYLVNTYEDCDPTMVLEEPEYHGARDSTDMPDWWMSLTRWQ
jgi:hypothetical protein